LVTPRRACPIAHAKRSQPGSVAAVLLERVFLDRILAPAFE
jgi:hypothetical protein